MNFPTNPIDGQIYTYSGTSFIYSDSYGVWLLYASDSPTVRPTILVSNVPPENPYEGDLWLDSEDLKTYARFDGQWIQI